MNKVSLFALSLVALATSAFAAEDYSIKKVDTALVTTPQYSVNPPAKQTKVGQWLAIDVSFDATPEFVNELTFTYYVAFKGNHPEVQNKVFVGRVNHVSIPKGRDLHSVAYISPRALSRIMKGKLFNLSDIDMVTVTITKPGVGAPISAKGTGPFTPNWWASFQAEEGAVLNKNETPFAPLSWDYYEAIKPAGSR